MVKKNVLFILPFLPYPLKSGGHQAIFNGIKAFVNDINAFVLYEEEWNEDLSQEEKAFAEALDCKVKVYKYKRKEPAKESFALRAYIKYWRLKGFIKNFFFKPGKPDLSILPLQVKSQDLIHFVNNIIEQEKITIVQCEMLETANHILSLPKSIRTIFVHHEIKFIRQGQELDSGRFSKESKQIFINNKKNEIFLLNKFDDVITLSERDSCILQSHKVQSRLNTSLASVVAGGTSNETPFDCYKLSFVGPSFHAPNLIGILWFLENCWSNLLRVSSKYQLQIIGIWSKKEVEDITKKYPNVTFKGFVPNLASEIAGTIMIVPITEGSGIRMKILEAARIGCPVVSTSIGAQGIPLQDDKECLIGDSPDLFMSKIECLQNLNLASNIILAANKKIQQEYSIEKLRTSRIHLYI